MTTPAQDKGIIVNVTRLKLTGNDGDYSNYKSRQNKVWILSSDDGSSCPYFDAVDGSETNFCAYVRDFSVTQEVPAVPARTIQIDFSALETRTVNTIQSQAIATFNTMRNRAIAHRNGESQSDSLFYTGYGICDNIHRCMPDGASSDTMALIKDNLIRRVPSYSGNYHYPVNHPKGGSTQKERSQAADNAWCEFNNKWGGEYGALRLAQLEELIEHIENKWDDALAKDMTPATRVGLVVGVSLVEYRDGTIWRFVRDDKSADPYFESVTTSNQTSLDLRYVTILQMEEDNKKRSVSQFLKEIARQAAKRDKLQAQIAELQKQAADASQRIAMLDYGLGNAHKVQRMAK